MLVNYRLCRLATAFFPFQRCVLETQPHQMGWAANKHVVHKCVTKSQLIRNQTTYSLCSTQTQGPLEYVLELPVRKEAGP